MKSTELLEQLYVGELVLGTDEDGLPVKLDLKEAPGPVFVIAQTESKTHDLLMLAAASCRQSSPDRRLTVITENPTTWKEIKLDFATTVSDPRLVEHLNQIISQPDTRHLLIVEGLENSGQIPEKAKPCLHALLKNGDQSGNIQIIASVNPDRISGGINQLITTYLGANLIWGITETTEANHLQPNQFLAAGMGQNGESLKFSLPEI